ncbi:hypothetical protein BJ878DRAFT_486516, partial [Calycina marina]
MATVHLLKARLNVVESALHELFSRCLGLSYFPNTWKNAEVAMLPKLAKKDLGPLYDP